MSKKKVIKRKKIKNIPMFLVVGIVLMIMIILSIYYIFLYYAPEMILPYSGYAIQAKIMIENLKSSNISEVERYIDLVEVKEQELVYKKLNSYYVGEKEKTQIDVNYPIYVNHTDTLLNLSKDTELITVNYEKVEGYPEFLLTGGIMYNGDNLTRADGNEYLFLKTADDIYTNIEEIEIQTQYNTYKISENSHLYFTQESISYYERKATYLEYHHIEDIDRQSKVIIKGETLTYEEFLEKLGMLEQEQDKEEEESNEIKENTIQDTNTQETTDKEKVEDNKQEVKWVKPEVSCSGFEEQVYSIKTNLQIVDKAGVITKGIIFEFRKEEKLNRRVQILSSGVSDISGLEPDAEYEITGIFYYADEEGEEHTEVFYEGTVHTKSVKTLGTVQLSFENGDIYYNKVEIKNVKIANDLADEVLKGVTKISMQIDGIQYNLSAEQIRKLKKGEEITYQTSENVKSNQTIRYEIKAYDKYGNELRIEPKEGKTRTSKEQPKVTINATKQDVVETILSLQLENPNRVKLENYKYVITDQSGNVVRKDSLKESNNTLTFTDLDPNSYYKIDVYADYDLNDGKGLQKNQVIGSGTFVTLPISSLGYLQINIEEKEITQSSIEMEIKLNEKQTDIRLIQILEKVEIIITSEKGEEHKKQLSAEEVANLKVAEVVTLKFDALSSNTKYTINIMAVAKQGSVEETVEAKPSIEGIITRKKPAEVQIRNQFVIGDMIDFDVKITDIDGAVLTNQVRIEVRDEQNKLVALEEIKTNQEFDRRIYENLEEKKNYKILFYAPQYNEGSTDNTYQANYKLKQINIYTELGISGTLELEKIGRTGTGKNLIDVSSKVNWYANCFSYGGHYGLTYDENTKILTLGGSSQGNRDYLYDLTSYLGQEVTISFQARYISRTNMYIYNGGNKATISDLTTQWQEYSYTLTVGSNGYVGFRIADANNKVEIQNLQIELGNRKTSYQEFRYILEANMNINVNDERDEISTNDYYVRIYKNGEQIQELRYEEIGEENLVKDAKKTYQVEENATYEIELLVKINDRYYTLDSQLIQIEQSTEIKGISSVEDYLKIQPYGQYIVLQDLELTDWGNTYEYRFGRYSDSSYMYVDFEGKIDFNGKTVTKDASSAQSMFDGIGVNGIIENLVLDIKLDNEVEISNYMGLANVNRGTVKNIQMNLIESTSKRNFRPSLIIRDNYGTLENFVANFKQPLYVTGDDYNGGVVTWNKGVIKNGYVYGENIKVIGGISNIAGVVSCYNHYNARIENVYSLVSIDLMNGAVVEKKTGNIVYNNIDNATMQNVYSVGNGENTTNYSNGPNVYSVSSKKIYHSYYFADEVFVNAYNIKGNKLALWDVSFQNQLINTSDAFEVNASVAAGYYPQLKMSEVMPRQEYIELPEVTDADLPDILSTKVLEQGSNKVKVEMSVNNPSAEQINRIQIENMTVNILSQEYDEGKSTVIAELTNPVVCVSKYNVLSISTKSAFNTTYTRRYETGERVIYVDLYKEIWSVSDWKNIAKSTTENYMLMVDLDFINEGDTVRLSRIDGIINGNNHCISNANMTGSTGLINNLYGEIRNLNFKQINLTIQTTGDGCGGVINWASDGAIIDNVHIQDLAITAISGNNLYAGGIIRGGSGITIKNSSVTNLTIADQMEDKSSKRIGGIIGEGYRVSVENCYVQNLQINVLNAVMTYTGGIIGVVHDYGNIKNCYAHGNILSEGEDTGGIVGYMVRGNIENCYTIASISSHSKHVGGIVGNILNEKNGVMNNLSIGNLYTTAGKGGLNRIIGNYEDTESNNYAYKNQLIQGYIDEEPLGATLLNEKSVLNLSLGGSYSYEGKEKGILPKLYNTEGTALLPNQQDYILERVVSLEIDSVEAQKPNTTEAQVSIIIDNPQEVEITEVQIEDMNCTVTRNVTQNGKTNVVLRGVPTRYYDNYKITNIHYKEGEEQKQREVEAQVDVQFYKEIYSYEDWQTIELGTYQNYRLMADIDFSGKTDVKSDITVNRLESENRVYTLKNINVTLNESNSGFIKNVKFSMKNISFENIVVDNTKSSGNYCGLIASNNGDLENLKFRNITVNAKGMNYVGMIGYHTSGNINNIVLDTINITGNDSVGGFIGRIASSIDRTTNITQITANDITVVGSSHYVGGVFGYGHISNTNAITNVTIENSNITGQNYTGGVSGTGSGRYFYSKNNQVTGASQVGGVFGSTSYSEFLKTEDGIIKGNGSYIGGIAGNASSNCQRSRVLNTQVEGTSTTSNGVGGVIGLNSAGGTTNFQVENTSVKSKGSNVGGVIGQDTGVENRYANTGYIYNVIVEGATNVGGVYGSTSCAQMLRINVNAQVKATSHTAGGVVGYINNTNMSAAVYTTRINLTQVLNTTVEAPSKAGGLIGDIAIAIYQSGGPYFYNNYIEAYVTSKDSQTTSLIIGGMSKENPYIENTYVYRYSTLNGEYVYRTQDVIQDSQYLVRSDLEKQDTYTNKIGLGTNYHSYTSLEQGKYPTIKDSQLYEPSLQEAIDLPVDPEAEGIALQNLYEEDEQETANTLREEAEEMQELPDITIYPISAYEFNVDFSTIPESTYFTYGVNGQEAQTKTVEQKTYTFEYNYQDIIELKIANTVEEKIITIQPEDLVSKISLVGNVYTYLEADTIYQADTKLEGEYVNLYKGKALNKEGYLYDIQTQSRITQEKIETKLAEVAKPQNQYSYNENQIDVYGTYSTINANIKAQIYTVKNGRLSAISNQLDWTIGNIITDYYNSKEYQTVLNTEGKLNDIKETLHYPENFLNENINQIVQNEDSEKTQAMVHYNTGKVIVFNYVTGEIIYENAVENSISLSSFMMDKFQNIFSDYEEKQEQYMQSQELLEKLEEMPVEKAIQTATNGNNSSTNQTNINYVTVYDPISQSYEIYSEDEIIESKEEEPISETKKIEINGLQNFYHYNTIQENTHDINGIAMIIIIFAIVMFLLILLRVYVRSKQKRSKK